MPSRRCRTLAPRSGPRRRSKLSCNRELSHRQRRPSDRGRPARRRDEIIAAAPSFGRSGRPSLATDKELSDFLKSVEKRAWKRAVYAVRDDDAALDIVQDAMIRLSEKYIDRPAAELPLLFQRILSNATMDWFRRQKVRNAVVRNFSDFEGAAGGDGDFDLLETLRGPRQLARARERRRFGVAGADLADRSRPRSAQLPGASTRGFSPALLGGTRCRRDSRLHGLFGRQRQDALLAGGPRLGQGSPGEGNRTMNQARQHLRPRRPRRHRIALRAQHCRPPERAHGKRRPGHRRAPALRPREGARRPGALARVPASSCTAPGGGTAAARLQPLALVAADRLGAAAGRR